MKAQLRLSEFAMQHQSFDELRGEAGHFPFPVFPNRSLPRVQPGAIHRTLNPKRIDLAKDSLQALIKRAEHGSEFADADLDACVLLPLLAQCFFGLGKLAVALVEFALKRLDLLLRIG